MEKMILEGVEIQFNDLSEQIQKKLYLKNEENYREAAIRSQFPEVRKLVIKAENVTSEELDEIFKLSVSTNNRDTENVELIWNHSKFKKDDQKRRMLVDSGCRYLKILVAKDKTTSSEFLNKILQEEVRTLNDYDVVEEVLDNPNFEMEEESLKLLSESYYIEYRLVAAYYKQTSSKILNQMLREEIKVLSDYTLITAIMMNQNFKMEDETLKKLAKSEEWLNRIRAAEYEGCTIEFLENMYITEKHEDVLETIENSLIKISMEKESITLDDEQKLKVIKALRKWKRNNKKKHLSEYLDELATKVLR